MTQQLVANIRLRGIEWLGMVTNVLGAKKDAKGKTVEEITRAQETCHRTHTKVGTTLKELADVLLLRDVVVIWRARVRMWQ